MTKIPGISIRKDAKGHITHITIEVAQQKELAQPVLDKLSSEASQFRQDFENGLTVEEARKDMIDHLKNLYAGNH